MQSMWQDPDESGERPAIGASPAEAPRLEDLTIISPRGELYGWAKEWSYHSLEDAELVLIPRLCLAPSPVYKFVRVMGYPEVFNDCVFSATGLNFLGFHVLGAVFPFYRTGYPELLQMVTVLKGSNVSSLGKILKEATSLLT